MFKREKQTPADTSRRPRQVGRAPAFSYYNNRSVVSLNTGRKEEVASRQIYRSGLRNLPVVISVMIMVFAALYATTLSATPNLNINSDSVLRRSNQAYAEGMSGILSSSVFHYSKLTINTDDVASQIETKYAELEGVSVTIPLLGRKPIVGASITKPAFVLLSGGERFYVRQDGVAMATAKDIGEVQVPTIIDLSDVPIEPGKAVLTSQSAEFITEVLGQLNAQKYAVDSVILPQAPNELQIKPAGREYRVRFNMLGDGREQAGALLALTAQLQGDNVVPAQYIDLRVEERAYYK